MVWGSFWEAPGPPKNGQKCKKTLKKRLLDAPWSPKCFLDRFLMVFASFLDGLWHPNLRDKSFPKQPYATRHPSYAVRYTLYRTNNLWDKSFQKQALGQIVPKTTLGQIVPKRKGPNKFPPPSPLNKKGPGVLPEV